MSSNNTGFDEESPALASSGNGMVEEMMAPPAAPDGNGSASLRESELHQEGTEVLSGTSQQPDVVTGQEGGAVDKFVQIRREDETEAMNPNQRRRNKLKAMLAFMTKRNVLEGHGKEESARKEESGRPYDFDQSERSDRPGLGQHGVTASQYGVEDSSTIKSQMAAGPQFTLRSRRKPTKSFSQKLMRMAGMSSGAIDATVYDSVSSKISWADPNQLLSRYLHWTFRTSFFMLIMSSMAAFIALTMFFGALILWIGKRRPACIQVGDFTFGEAGSYFKDAFSLSWTTFSTVGYGLVYPQVSTVGNIDRCVGITFVTSLESFVGVLFAGICGAILFGKVTRIGSQAQVIFSDPIVIRYGPGIRNMEDIELASESNKSGDPNASGTAFIEESYRDFQRKHIPCPILEFRVVNRLHSEVGGEIIDATLNVVAAIEEKDACPSVRDGGLKNNMKKKGRKRKRVGDKSKRGAEMDSDNIAGQTIAEEAPLDTSQLENELAMASLMEAANTNQTLDEGNSQLAPRRLFCKMELETPDHPFFKRVWVGRHRLDQESPLLTSHARRLVRRNDGFWPEELNTHEKVRESIQFNQIMVSLSGTSNVNASSVYSHKIYDFVDVNVGYMFANVLYRDYDGHLRVDTSITNDIMEQNGGGGEPLIDIEDDRLSARVVPKNVF